MGNVRANLPDDAAPQVRAIRDASTLDTARTQPDRAINRYRSEFPAAVTCLEDDLEALWAIHRVPVRHRVNVRTTNLAERSFVEERRRIKVIPCLLGEKSAMKLMFVAPIRCAERWSKIPVSDLERHQLQLLRQELGIDPPPDTERDQDNRRDHRRMNSHRFVYRRLRT